MPIMVPPRQTGLWFNMRILGLNLPPIFKVLTYIPSKNLLENSSTCLSSITRNPHQGLSKS